jgi:predicted hydrocarbon binding protein
LIYQIYRRTLLLDVEHEEHGIAMKFYAVNPNILSVAVLKENKLTGQIEKEIQEAMAARINGLDSEGNIAFLRLLKSTILSTGIDMDKPFYDAGYNIGSNVISKQMKTSSLKDALNELALMWEQLKLGTIEIKEIKCWGTGYDFCEFEIKELLNSA